MSPAASARPASTSGAVTGAAGVVALLGAALTLRDWLQPSYIKALATLGIAAALMIVVEVAFYRTHRNTETGLALVPLRPLDWRRVGCKVIGLWLSCGLAAAPYWVIPEFARDYFQPFRAAAVFLLPGLMLISPFYIAFVDRRQQQPEDAYAQLGMLVLGRPPADLTLLWAHARGWAIKAFFLPLMFVYVTADLGA